MDAPAGAPAGKTGGGGPASFPTQPPPPPHKKTQVTSPKGATTAKPKGCMRERRQVTDRSQTSQKQEDTGCRKPCLATNYHRTTCGDWKGPWGRTSPCHRAAHGHPIKQGGSKIPTVRFKAREKVLTAKFKLFKQPCMRFC